MKKKVRIVVIVTCALLLLCVGYFIFLREAQPMQTLQNPMSGNVDIPYPMSGTADTPYFALYEISGDSFFQFIEAPSVSLLNELSYRKSILSLSETSPDLIRREIVSDNPVQVFEQPDIRANNLLVSDPILRFIGNTAEIQAYLAEHGITDEIGSVAVLGMSMIPTTIWVQAGDENFFITYDLQSDGSGFAYRFYTHSKFEEQFSVKDGELIVNGIEIAHVKFHFDYVVLPLIATLEALGADTRQLDDGTILFAYNDAEFVLDKSEPSFVEVGMGFNLFMPPPGGYALFEVVDGEVMVDSTYTMREILRLIGAEMRIDNQQMTVMIDFTN